MTRFRAVCAAVVVASLIPAVASAQLSQRADPLGSAYVARQVRAVEALRATNPELAAQRATALRSQLQRGVATTGSAGGNAVVQRRMDEVVLRQPFEAQPGAAPLQGPVVQRPLAVPKSDDDPLRLSPQSTLVGDLLDRAEQAYADGRLAQAQSDLAFATSQLGATEGDAAGLELRQRAARLAQQIR